LTRLALSMLLLMTGTAKAAERFLPPPGPRIVDGTPIALEREVNGKHQIIHIPRSSPADFRQLIGDYVVELACSGDIPLSAQLSPRTSPFGSVNEELVFLSLPDGQESTCVLTVLDRSRHPWTRIFHGSIGSIPKMPD